MSLDLWLMAEWLHEELVRLHERLDQIMTDVVVQQEDLDALTQQINDSVTALQTQIASLEAAAANPAQPAVQLPPGSLDGLKAAVTDLQGLQAPATTPVPAPAPPAAAAPPDQALPPA
jgi:hypothetical protein